MPASNLRRAVSPAGPRRSSELSSRWSGAGIVRRLDLLVDAGRPSLIVPSSSIFRGSEGNIQGDFVSVQTNRAIGLLYRSPILQWHLLCADL